MPTPWQRIALALLFFIVPSAFFFSYIPISYAQTASTADQLNAQIIDLQQQIAQLESQLTVTTQQKQTIQTAIAGLNLNIQKLQKSLSLTHAQIVQNGQQTKKLASTIATTTAALTIADAGFSETMRQLDMLDAEPLGIVLLGGGSLSSFFDALTTLETVRSSLEDQIPQLSSLTQTLKNSKAASVEKGQQLASLQQTLAQQQEGLSVARESQTQLLAQTKSQEATYAAEITQKKAQEVQFEASLLTIGSSITTAINPTSLPPSGSDPLIWPIEFNVIDITQYFGNTPFATQNPQVYSGHGHDGIDIAASPGTPVHAARFGIVLGTGNTDLTCPQASFGKWVFIEHDDGLETMYAHLGVISVSQGQRVTTGQVIGYSDTTGYATGPHLHFGVYAAAGSEIKSWPTTNPRPICAGKIYTMPVAEIPAYLNPLSYLPPIPGR